MLRQLSSARHSIRFAAVTVGLALAPMALAQGPDGFGGPPNGRPDGPQAGGITAPRAMMMAPAMRQPPAPQMVTAGDYIYVLRGNTLTQLSVQGLKLLQTATLVQERGGPWANRPQGARGQNRRGPAGPDNGQAPGNPPALRQGPDGNPGDQAGPPNDAVPPGPPDAQGPGGPDARQQGPDNGPRGQGDQRRMDGAMPGSPGVMGRGGFGMGFRPQAPAVLTATSEYVYVLHGDTLYQFAVKGLKLQKKTTLPGDGPMGRAFQGGPGMGQPNREGPDGDRRDNGPAPRPERNE